jgi:hypothetical protein
MTRGRGRIDQHRQCTAREVRLEGSREFSSRRLSAHSTGLGQRNPSAPSEIAQKLNAGQRRRTIPDLSDRYPGYVG